MSKVSHWRATGLAIFFLCAVLFFTIQAKADSNEDSSVEPMCREYAKLAAKGVRMALAHKSPPEKPVPNKEVPKPMFDWVQIKHGFIKAWDLPEDTDPE